MIEVGRLIVKIAGRDAGKKGLIVEILDDNYVTIDGQVRRRKCNIIHIEPLNKVLKIKDKATHDEVVKVLKTEGLEVKEKKAKDNPKQKNLRSKEKGKRNNQKHLLKENLKLKKKLNLLLKRKNKSQVVPHKIKHHLL